MLPDVNTNHIDPDTTISQDILKKYILYARKNIHPKFPQENVERVMNFYAELRKESSTKGGITIVARHIESLIRMAQASAKMHLRQEVKKEDVDLAISVLRRICLTKSRVSCSPRRSVSPRPSGRTSPPTSRSRMTLTSF